MFRHVSVELQWDNMLFSHVCVCVCVCVCVFVFVAISTECFQEATQYITTTTKIFA